MAQLIREGVNAVLMAAGVKRQGRVEPAESLGTTPEEVRVALAAASAASSEEKRRRALEVVGRFHSGTGDLAERHDEYFVEAIEACWNENPG